MNTTLRPLPIFLSLLVLSIVSLHAQTCPSPSAVTVMLSPGDNVQQIVNSSPCGSKFVFTNGVYPNVTIFPIDEATNPLDYDQFVAQNARQAHLYGATIVSFQQQSPYWVGHVTTTPASPNGSFIQCDPQHPACMLPEDLFFDGKLYLRVTSLSSVGAGKWYLDYKTGTVYLTDNPTGHKVEVSITHFAIYAGNVANVVITGLVIEKYAVPPGFGAITGLDPTGATTQPTYKWQVRNNEIRNNHAAGVWLGNAMIVYNNFVHNNGEFGVAGTGNNLSVNSNEISFNNLAGFVPAWGGGTKFVNVLNLVANHNNIHDNKGPGLWDDINNSNVTFAFNTLTRNQVAAIFHEISFAANIHDNTITNDGVDTRGTGPWFGAGIMIANSSNVNVYNNKVTDCQNGIMLQAKNRPGAPNGGSYLLQNVHVYNNSVTQGTGEAAGLLVSLSGTTAYPPGTAVYTTEGNEFGMNGITVAPNTYALSTAGGDYFIWILNGTANSFMTLSQWQAAGED